MSDTTQIERQLYILSLLSESKNGCTIEDINKYLFKVGIEVSKKTIERDIDYLSVVNFPVSEEKRGKETYYTSEKFGLEDISFTLNELISLYFLKEIINSYSALEIGTSASILIDRIISHLPQINRNYIESLNKLVKVNPIEVVREKAINPEYLKSIRDAISFRKKLWICYCAFNSEETTERYVNPYMLEIHKGCYHLVGYCHLRKNIREFRISRMKDLKVMDESFEKPEDFYEEYKKSKFDKLSGEKEINLKLKFKGLAARFIKEYEYEKADLITPIEDDEILFEKNTTMSPEIVKWVLGYGSSVVVLEPKELKDQIITEAENILKNYNRNIP